MPCAYLASWAQRLRSLAAAVFTAAFSAALPLGAASSEALSAARAASIWAARAGDGKCTVSAFIAVQPAPQWLRRSSSLVGRCVAMLSGRGGFGFGIPDDLRA